MARRSNTLTRVLAHCAVERKIAEQLSVEELDHKIEVQRVRTIALGNTELDEALLDTLRKVRAAKVAAA